MRGMVTFGHHQHTESRQGAAAASGRRNAAVPRVPRVQHQLNADERRLRQVPADPRRGARTATSACRRSREPVRSGRRGHDRSCRTVASLSPLCLPQHGEDPPAVDLPKARGEVSLAGHRARGRSAPALKTVLPPSQRSLAQGKPQTSCWYLPRTVRRTSSSGRILCPQRAQIRPLACSSLFSRSTSRLSKCSSASSIS
jgi:hypothetical protein